MKIFDAQGVISPANSLFNCNSKWVQYEVCTHFFRISNPYSNLFIDISRIGQVHIRD